VQNKLHILINNGRQQFPPFKKIDDLHRNVITESKYGTQIAPSPTIFVRDAFKVKKYMCSNIYIYIYIYVSVGVTRKVYSGLRTRIGRRVTRSWDK
jgi:hypothetical protein